MNKTSGGHLINKEKKQGMGFRESGWRGTLITGWARDASLVGPHGCRDLREGKEGVM